MVSCVFHLIDIWLRFTLVILILFGSAVCDGMVHVATELYYGIFKDGSGVIWMRWFSLIFDFWF